MQEHENSVRQAQLREAAGLLSEWIHARRATWTDEPLESAPLPVVVAAPPPVVVVDLPVPAPPPPPSRDEVAFDFASVEGELAADPFADFEPDFAEHAIAESVAEPARPSASLQAPMDAARSLSASLGRTAGRAGSMGASLLHGTMERFAPLVPAMIVVVVVAVGGWLAFPYVGGVKTWLTGPTEKTASTEPEAAPPRATQPAGGRRTGQIVARSEPDGAKVFVDGKERGVTPLTLDDIAPGSHTVVLQSDKGSVRRTVTVAANRPAMVSESIFAGWLAVFAPFEVQISEGTSAIRLNEDGKVLLPPGTHELRFENRALGFAETRRVEVQPGQTTSLSLVTAPSTLTVTANTPAVVFIDGQQVGDTPLANQPIALGTRDIVVRGADGSERRFTRRVTVAPVQIDVDFSKP